MSQIQRESRINDVLYYIHQDISKDLNAKHLAQLASYSEQHFHRVFQQVVGEAVHTYIRRSRLEFAANQLTFNPKLSIIEVAERCGFASVSAFSRAFKSLFKLSPGQWRKNEISTSKPPYLSDIEISKAYDKIYDRALPEPKIVEVKERHVAYIRHQGYNRQIKSAWQGILAWANAEQRSTKQQFGLHHSNPTQIDLQRCRYVACIEIDKPILKRGMVNSLTIPAGLHAVFSLSGKYGELLPYISNIMEKWLPSTHFKLQSTPAYVHYHKNHFIADDEKFELDFYLPIGVY